MKKLLFILLTVFTVNTSFAQAEAFLGEVRIWAGSFAPRGWMFCEGQTLNINQYQALYSLLGTQYGGNGVTTFNIPDLRGRVPVGVNQNSTQSFYINPGQLAGNTTTTLIPMNIPYTVVSQNIVPKVKEDDTQQTTSYVLGSVASPFSIVQPSLGIRYIICTTNGLYPSRD